MVNFIMLIGMPFLIPNVEIDENHAAVPLVRERDALAFYLPLKMIECKSIDSTDIYDYYIYIRDNRWMYGTSLDQYEKDLEYMYYCYTVYRNLELYSIYKDTYYLAKLRGILGHLSYYNGVVPVIPEVIKLKR